jgi:hypothetical protein
MGATSYMVPCWCLSLLAKRSWGPREDQPHRWLAIVFADVFWNQNLIAMQLRASQ